MSKNGKRSEPCEFTYIGPEREPALKPVESEPVPPSPELAKMVTLSVLGGNRGAYRTADHFQERLKERDFDVFDIEYSVRNGQCVGPGEYSSTYRNFKYVFRCDIDGVGFDAVIALSAEHDLLSSPLLILITGCWKTKTGRRSSRY